MAEGRRVFLVDTSIEESRPKVDFSHRLSQTDWILVGEVLRGERDEKDYPGVFVLVNDRRALEWDYYANAGTFGFMSERAVNLIRPYSSDYFKFFPAWINAAPYYMLKRVRTLDC